MRSSLDPEVMGRREAAMKICGCPKNAAGDIRCHQCLEYANVRCWNCRTIRGEGPCPTPIESGERGGA